MRRKKGTLKFVAVFLGALFAAALLYALTVQSVFEGGEGYELYCGTSSAEIIRTKNPALMKFLRPDVCGESARYKGDLHAEFIERFSAEIRFTEEAAGVVNYYLYAPDLGHGVLICGHEVNLHIAVSGEQTAIGTPIIFGGF